MMLGQNGSGSTRWIVVVLLLIGILQECAYAEAFGVVGPRLKRHSRIHPVVAQPSDKMAAAAAAESSVGSSGAHESLVVLRAARGGGGEGATESLWTKPFWKALLAEFIGTGLIVALGTGSVMSAIYTNSLTGLWQIAAVWIIGVTIAIATTGPISGAHLNPAVSIAFAWLRPQDFSWSKVLPYSVAQTLGAAFFSFMNYIMYSTTIVAHETVKQIARGSSIETAKAFGEYFSNPVTTGTALLVEAFGTAVLAFVIFSLTNPKNDCQKNKVYIPPIIGATVGGLICVLAPLTQAGFNPARDFGPRIVAGLAGWGKLAFQSWWVYIVGPIIGAVLGGALADKVLYADC